jgi:hypothetical protein
MTANVDVDDSVELPDDAVTVLETDEHIHVEKDGEVKTQ